jgi:isoleucyl-tRNA synthetase
MVFEGKEGAHVAEEDGIVVSLDIEITQDLLEEGYVREIVRNLQEMRKDAGYEVSDRISVFVGSEKMSEVVAQYSGYITKETLANELQQKGGFAPDIEREIELDEIKITLGVRR